MSRDHTADNKAAEGDREREREANPYYGRSADWLLWELRLAARDVATTTGLSIVEAAKTTKCHAILCALLEAAPESEPREGRWTADGWPEPAKKQPESEPAKFCGSPECRYCGYCHCGYVPPTT